MRSRQSKPIPWTAEQFSLLEKLHAAGVPWEEIAPQCGHGIESCRTTFYNRRLRRETDSARGSNHTINRLPWSIGDTAILVRMRIEERRSFPEIDVALNRAAGSSSSKFHSLRSPEALQFRNHNFETRAIHAPKYVPQYTELTAAFFGDPVPGRSALDDKRRQQEGAQP